VVANTLVFAMTYADQPDDYTAALEHVNLGELQVTASLTM
jgi:hypothetical protein